MEIRASMASSNPPSVPRGGTPVIDRVLTCQNLPSLPSVAMRVLELAQDKNVSSQEIAATIQSDPALTTKVLRTVNSSFYGLTTPCPSIKRATSLLGLNTVKSIVLGFSLVDSTKKSGLDRSFDMAAYWRRAVYAAAGARTIGLHIKRCDPEEAFVGALLQDIGVLAFAATLKNEYDAVLAIAGCDHDQHAATEQEKFGIDHAQMGAMLAEKWRLPPQITECIRWHHAPERCAPTHELLVKCVALGAMAAAVLNDTNDKRRLGAYIGAMRTHLNLEPAAARELLAATNENGQQLGKSLELSTGTAADVTQIMAMAHEQLIAAQVEMQLEATELRRSNADLTRKTVTDGLTGAFNRAHFDAEMKAAFEKSNTDRTPVTMLFCDADKFKSVNDTHGHQAGDAVLIELSKRLRDTLTHIGLVCRYGGEEFAIIVPGADAVRGEKVAELLRRRVCATPFEITTDGSTQLKLPVSISVGVATHDPSTGSVFATAEVLVHTADLGVYAAKQAGRNCVRVGREAAAAPVAVATRFMAVEDDPLAARLLSFLFEKRRDLQLCICTSGEEAVEKIKSGAEAPHVMLCDLNLPGISGIEVIKRVKALPGGEQVRGAILSASSDPVRRQEAADAGIRLFLEKGDFCANFERWIETLLQPDALKKAA